MYPWRRILIPTDFSTASEWVFEDAVRLAGSTGAEIVILHIRTTRTSNAAELRFPADDSLYDYAERIELEKLRDRVRVANATIPARLVVKRAPDPGVEIARSAAEIEADLVVIATHARHHVAHLFVGSTTQHALSNSPAPLLAIRYGIPKRRSMQRIVVPVHQKQTSHAALDLAGAIVRREQGSIRLITICPDAERNAARDRLDELATTRLEGLDVERTVVAGSDVQKELIRYTDRTDADAIFLNAADAPSALKLDIIRHASVPVMIVPV